MEDILPTAAKESSAMLSRVIHCSGFWVSGIALKAGVQDR